MWDFFGDPLGWINERLQSFLAVPDSLDKLESDTRAVFQAEAQARYNGPNPGVQSEREIAAIYLLNELADLRRDWNGTRDRLQIVEGPLAGPLIVAGIWGVAAIAVAISIYSIFRRRTAAESAVQHLIESGAPPEEILAGVKATQEEKEQGLDLVVSQLGSILKIAALAGLAMFIIPALSTLRRK